MKQMSTPLASIYSTSVKFVRWKVENFLNKISGYGGEFQFKA